MHARFCRKKALETISAQAPSFQSCPVVYIFMIFLSTVLQKAIHRLKQVTQDSVTTRYSCTCKWQWLTKCNSEEEKKRNESITSLHRIIHAAHEKCCSLKVRMQYWLCQARYLTLKIPVSSTGHPHRVPVLLAQHCSQIHVEIPWGGIKPSFSYFIALCGEIALKLPWSCSQTLCFVSLRQSAE